MAVASALCRGGAAARSWSVIASYNETAGRACVIPLPIRSMLPALISPCVLLN